LNAINFCLQAGIWHARYSK